MLQAIQTLQRLHYLAANPAEMRSASAVSGGCEGGGGGGAGGGVAAEGSVRGQSPPIASTPTVAGSGSNATCSALDPRVPNVRA